MAEEQTEWFTTWGGRVMGIVGLVVVAFFLLAGVTGWGGDYHPAAYVVLGLIALVDWVVMLRPAVGIRGEELVLRNPLTTVTLPLAAIQEVAIGQFLAVLVSGRRYTNSGIGRGRSAARRDDAVGEASPQRSYGGLIESRIRQRANDARARQGIEDRSDEQDALAADVRREPARVELAVLGVLVVALVVTLAV
ncbi:hypothetical protein F0U44_02205 [Nocardioides humilatus]|uniref:PH domain-containing protein n=1 Tax=Nocardioides humilatus TaxID=2607660 RepID=A0A5B1LM33_9ACTN|nr:hypothetical protein [Nocardioides humilatus]KAA1421148.1 hypothetical protein F0U44_02205 [Nocardioides humilatus]